MVRIKHEELVRLMRKAEKRQATLEMVFGALPRLMEATGKMDAATKKAIVLKRGERGKRAGGIVFEEATVDLIKRLKGQFMQDGYGDLDAGAKAREVLALVAGVKSTSLEAWEKGRNRQERKKPIEERSYRRRKRKKPGAD